jgi:hypothetical protein
MYELYLVTASSFSKVLLVLSFRSKDAEAQDSIQCLLHSCRALICSAERAIGGNELHSLASGRRYFKRNSENFILQ